MTTEDDFQLQLDTHPDDWQTRLVFADWLEEQGDKRATGYRSLGLLRIVPECWGGPLGWCYHNGCRDDVSPSARMPQDWLDLTQLVELGRHRISELHSTYLSSCKTQPRQQLEDAAALAFLRLPPERQAELLTAAAVG